MWGNQCGEVLQLPNHELLGQRIMTVTLLVVATSYFRVWTCEREDLAI
jgi:hypothetical protein